MYGAAKLLLPLVFCTWIGLGIRLLFAYLWVDVLSYDAETRVLFPNFVANVFGSFFLGVFTLFKPRLRLR